jgi:hypothetical protein
MENILATSIVEITNNTGKLKNSKIGEIGCNQLKKYIAPKIGLIKKIMAF